MITKERIKKAQQCLADNGIPYDETATVLQALGFILFDVDLGFLLDWDKKDLGKKEEKNV